MTVLTDQVNSKSSRGGVGSRSTPFGIALDTPPPRRASRPTSNMSGYEVEAERLDQEADAVGSVGRASRSRWIFSR